MIQFLLTHKFCYSMEMFMNYSAHICDLNEASVFPLLVSDREDTKQWFL
jgi:hypothetical protein